MLTHGQRHAIIRHFCSKPAYNKTDKEIKTRRTRNKRIAKISNEFIKRRKKEKKGKIK